MIPLGILFLNLLVPNVGDHDFLNSHIIFQVSRWEIANARYPDKFLPLFTDSFADVSVVLLLYLF